MPTPGVDIAEAYYMRKLSKENMKKVENNNKLKSAQQKPVDQKYVAKVESASSSVVCFSRMFKKVYPSKNNPNIP
ncbi:hypothetical protein CASFOL_034650 [Castilleja foliolosa]|uniref:Uncharacterized protein n=1 Tax=Castilleja foliolosa TaxID=1961234 RepID=A0ABD3BQG2_9LAMI